MAVVTGITEARRALREIERRAARPDLTPAARVLAQQARRSAPQRTGSLSRSIRAQRNGVVAGVRYAPFVHYGTSRQRPQPFMWGAWQRRKGDITEAYIGEIESIVRSATRGL